MNPLPYVKNSKKIVAPVSSRKLQPVVAKANTTLQPIKKTQAHVSPVLPASIIKRITISSDPAAKYLMTKQASVIRVYNGRKETIGKWKKSASVEYPYTITLADNKTIYINRTGQILTSDGKQVGAVS